MQSRIREVRRARGLTLADVAARCDPPTTAQTIGRLETGMRTLSLVWLERIATALGVEPAELVVLPDAARLPLVAALDGAEVRGVGDGQLVQPQPIGPAMVAMRVDAGVGDYRAGDLVLLDRFDGADAARALNRDVLVPRSGGRFHFARLIGLDAGRLHLLPFGSGARQIVAGAPEWIGVAVRLIRTL